LLRLHYNYKLYFNKIKHINLKKYNQRFDYKQILKI